jgi:hypothetical protein
MLVDAGVSIAGLGANGKKRIDPQISQMARIKTDSVRELRELR